MFNIHYKLKYARNCRNIHDRLFENTPEVFTDITRNRTQWKLDVIYRLKFDKMENTKL